MSEARPKGYNPKQWAAVVYPTDKDLLISAGAGSGKTRTLSVRVKRIIEKGEVSPESLLVLTFTDNAAHEMKERIVSLFQQDEDSKIRALAVKMQSAHIQTFDSFCQYLVSTYAGRLGISSSVTVLDETIEKTKRHEFLNEVLQSWYDDEEKREILAKTLVKFNAKGDSETRTVLLDLDRKLNLLPPSSRSDFFSRYEEVFFDEGKFSSWYDEYVEGMKDLLRQTLLRAKYVDEYSSEDGIEGESKEERERRLNVFKSPSFFQVVSYTAKESQCFVPLADELTHLLSLSSERFVEEAKEDMKTFSKKFKAPTKKTILDSEDPRLPIYRTIFTILKSSLTTQKALLRPLLYLGSKKEEYEKFLSFKDDIRVLLEIVKEMEEKLEEYKRTVNCFTFSDIASYALSLLRDPAYEDVAESVRSRFSYIMVDEYQDTNDSQEAFLDALLKPNKEGKRAHLFCVGDPKQAIYGFRNSNVKLFMARQEALEKVDPESVIHMNNNYRSGENLLSEINFLFRAYMSKEHGDVDYTLEDEQLRYDEDANPYAEEYPGFRISRLVSGPGDYEGMAPLDWEIQAIAQDILKKVNDPSFTVYDLSSKEKKIRRARFSDFAILCRVKSSFLSFQKAFIERGIPLNIKVSSNLKELSCILTLESLVGLLVAIKKKNDAELPHLFASLARSYLFEYTDEKVFSVLGEVKKALKEKKNDPFSLIKEDPIYQKALGFLQSHEHSDFPSLFRNLIEDFGVISSLSRLGDIEDNVAKIESLYSLAVSESKMGEGIQDFASLFSSIEKYALPFESESSFAAENSVDLMTIHASKGLERKIVYMPVSQNAMGKGGGKAPDYAFSELFGILLPNYYLPEEVPEEESPIGVYSLPYMLYRLQQSRHNVEEDEHVRLFYVAFTRAQNSLIIVGDDKKRKLGDLYEALDYIPHHKEFEPSLLKMKKASGVFSQAALNHYEKLVKEKNGLTVLKESEFDTGHPEKDAASYRYYLALRQEFVVDPLDQQIEDAFFTLEHCLLEEYRETVRKRADDLDFLARVYGLKKGLNGDSFESLAASYPGGEETLKAKLSDFVDALIKMDGERLGVDLNKEDKKDPALAEGKIAAAYLYPLAACIDGVPYAYKTTYQSKGFSDRFELCSCSGLTNNVQAADPSRIAPRLKEEQRNDEEIVFETKAVERASKKLPPIDEENPAMREILSYGTRLHRYMELVDFSTRDTSFIADPKDRERIDKVLSAPFFQSINEFQIYKEYGYFDPEKGSTGFIDLLLQKGNEFLIVDYKASETDDPAYRKQLSSYRDNVCRLFHVQKESVRAFLLPLTGEEIQEVALD